MLQGPCLKHHISLWARPAAALGNRQTEGPQRQRRSGKSYQNSGYDHNSSSTGSPNNSRGPSRRRQNDPSEYSQQATWQQRRRPSQRGRSASRGYDDDDEEDFDAVDRDFLDPEQAAKLRKLIKSQGRDAVLDKQGFVKETLLQGEDADADQASSSSSSNRSTMTNQRRRPGAASSSPAPTGSRGTSHDANSSQQGRTKLFDPSQLRAAALGSGGAVAALPVVRPSSGAGAGSSSSAAVGAGREAITAAVAARAKRASAPQSAFHSSSSWDDVGASQQVQDALAAIGIDRPSHVQAEAYKALSTKSGFKHVAVADQAGSGKTLAYLLPLLQQLKEREEKHGGPLTRPNSPSIVITTPTTGAARISGRRLA